MFFALCLRCSLGKTSAAAASYASKLCTHTCSNNNCAEFQLAHRHPNARMYPHASAREHPPAHACMSAQTIARPLFRYSLAGKAFSLTSPAEVAKVLYDELKLRPSSDKLCRSTKNIILQELVDEGHELPRLVILWYVCPGWLLLPPRLRYD